MSVVFWKENVSFIAICKHCGYFASEEAWGTSKEQEKLESNPHTHALLTSLSKPAVDPSRWLSLALIHSAPLRSHGSERILMGEINRELIFISFNENLIQILIRY